jgi:hypothetical protein
MALIFANSTSLSTMNRLLHLFFQAGLHTVQIKTEIRDPGHGKHIEFMDIGRVFHHKPSAFEKNLFEQYFPGPVHHNRMNILSQNSAKVGQVLATEPVC